MSGWTSWQTCGSSWTPPLCRSFSSGTPPALLYRSSWRGRRSVPPSSRRTEQTQQTQSYSAPQALRKKNKIYITAFKNRNSKRSFCAVSPQFTSCTWQTFSNCGECTEASFHLHNPHNLESVTSRPHEQHSKHSWTSRKQKKTKNTERLCWWSSISRMEMWQKTSWLTGVLFPGTQRLQDLSLQLWWQDAFLITQLNRQ